MHDGASEGSENDPIRVTGNSNRRKRPSDPCFELTDTPRGGGFVRQRALVGDSLDDEQRSDDLSDPLSHHPTCSKIEIAGKHKPESQ